MEISNTCAAFCGDIRLFIPTLDYIYSALLSKNDIYTDLLGFSGSSTLLLQVWVVHEDELNPTSMH